MATSSLRVDTNNDFYVDAGGNLELVTNIDAVEQDIRLQCLMTKGENIYNVNEGVDYFNNVFSPQTSYDDARKSIRETLMSSPDVFNVASIEIVIDANTFEFTAEVNTTYGNLTVKNK